MKDLSLSELHRVNLDRCVRWHPEGIQEWSVNDWLAAFGGEAGEALNAGKKHRRILSGIQQHGNVPTSERDAAEKIMEELADTVIYADLCASRLGLNLAEAIIKKFNAISRREGFPERLSPKRVMVCGVDCHPGDSVCNNYCNAAPQKGPMADVPPAGPDALFGEGK